MLIKPQRGESGTFNKVRINFSIQKKEIKKSKMPYRMGKKL